MSSKFTRRIVALIEQTKPLLNSGPDDLTGRFESIRGSAEAGEWEIALEDLDALEAFGLVVAAS